jgi:hypothetical protein
VEVLVAVVSQVEEAVVVGKFKNLDIIIKYNSQT